jgi:putative transposase
MPRANRHSLPGYIWPITHRCHQKELLLRFARDRQAGLGWLLEAKKRFGLKVLHDTVTSNHIPRLGVDGKEPDTIPNSLQLMAGRTGRHYKQRKQRQGAFWEGRYQVTAVESGEPLIQWLVYMDLNRVRAGGVRHPEQWPFGGYRESQNPKPRYGIISYQRLMGLGMKSLARVPEALRQEPQCRQAKWSESLVVGGEQSVGDLQRELGLRAQGRKVVKEGGSHHLRESETTYRSHDEDGKGLLRISHTFLWNLTSDSSMS